MIADSRLTRIRSLATESEALVGELINELDPWNPDVQHLRITGNYLRRVINKTNLLETP